MNNICLHFMNFFTLHITSMGIYYIIYTNICNNYFLTSWFLGCKNFWSDCMRLKDARLMGGGASTHAIYKGPREIPAFIDF